MLRLNHCPAKAVGSQGFLFLFSHIRMNKVVLQKECRERRFSFNFCDVNLYHYITAFISSLLNAQFLVFSIDCTNQEKLHCFMQVLE